MVKDRIWRLAQVAKMYYEENLTQESIAKRLRISRSTISRLLESAKRNGIVEVKIHFPWQRAEDLEKKLCKRYTLKTARVLKTVAQASDDEIVEGLGILAAQYFSEIVEPNTIVAITSGKSIYQMVNALDIQNLNLTVVQVMGVINCENPLIDGPELAQLMVHHLGGRYIYMQAPFVIKDPEVHRRLYAEQPFLDVIDNVKNANYALIGIGSVDPQDSNLLRTGFSYESLVNLNHQGAVGEIGGQSYNILGQPVQSDLDQKPVSIDLKYFKDIPTVIAIAGGPTKVEAIQGALAGRYFDVLVTDQGTAETLLGR